MLELVINWAELACSFVAEKINPRDFTINTPQYPFSWLAGYNKHLCQNGPKGKKQNTTKQKKILSFFPEK